MPPDKCQIFPQIDTNTLGVWPGMPKLPQKNKSAVSLQYLKKEVSDEIDFCMLQIDTMALIGTVKHSQSS